MREPGTGSLLLAEFSPTQVPTDRPDHRVDGGRHATGATAQPSGVATIARSVRLISRGTAMFRRRLVAASSLAGPGRRRRACLAVACAPLREHGKHRRLRPQNDRWHQR